MDINRDDDRRKAHHHKYKEKGKYSDEKLNKKKRKGKR